VRLFGFRCRTAGGTISLREHLQSRWLDRSKLLERDLAPADVPIAEALGSAR
jgi:hypothetical protein